MEGWYRLQRGWMNHEAFSPEPLTEREAWLWLIETAAWKDHKRVINGAVMDVKRGQVVESIRFMAEAWGWTKWRVERFLDRLVVLEMIEKTGHRTGRSPGHISLRNYEKYQSAADTEPDTKPDANRTRTGHKPDKVEERKERKERKKDSSAGAADLRVIDGGRPDYAFEGVTFRLNRTDFERWRRSFPAIPDLAATLQAADDYYRDNPPDDGKVFFRVSKWLERANREAKAERRQAAYGDEWW